MEREREGEGEGERGCRGEDEARLHGAGRQEKAADRAAVMSVWLLIVLSGSLTRARVLWSPVHLWTMQSVTAHCSV